MTTPADELRIAAQKLRALADTAQRDLETDVYWTPYTSNAWAQGFINGFGGVSSEYVAVLPPTVGTALAELLERMAKLAGLYATLHRSETGTTVVEQHPDGTIREALAVARAINGTAS
jgi:hypothetical protein